MNKDISWEIIDDNSELPKKFWDAPGEFIRRHAAALKQSGYHRDVYFLPLADTGEKVLIKHFVLSTFKEKIKWKLRKSAAQKEWELLNYLRENNVPAPRPLALGVAKSKDKIDVWLLIDFIENAVTFDKVTPPKSPKKVLQGAKALAESIASLHFFSVRHGDLHSGNLLYLPEENKWLITDFQRAKMNCFSKSDFIKDLVQLNHCIGKKVRLGVRAVFIKTYLQKFSELTGAEKQIAAWEWKNLFFEIGRKARLYSIHQAKVRAKRCEKSNNDFASLNQIINDNSNLNLFENAWVKRGVSKQLINDLINLISDKNWYLDADITIIKNRPSVAVGVWPHPHGNLFIKQYRYRNSLREKIMKFFHKSKSHRNWRAVWRMRHMHINTPKPVLVAWSERGGFIVWECLSAGISCEAALIRLTELGDDERKIDLIRKIALEIGLLHDRGVEHGDLKSSNVLILNAYEKNARVYLTDVDAAKFYSYIPFSKRVRDLARLYAALFPFVSNYEVRFFLRRYLRLQSEEIDVRQLILSVRERAQKKIIQKHYK